MVKVFNIRGTNGSGKSTLVRSLLPENWTHGQSKDTSVTFGGDIAVIGKYVTACGGCDTIKTQEGAKNSIRLAMGLEGVKNVVFEGVLISTIYKPWVEFDKSIGGMYWCYLDTPLELCIQRIYERNGGKEINEQLVRDKYRTIQRTRQYAKESGMKVVDIDHKDAVNQLRELMK